MSEVAQVALITGGIGFLTVLLTYWFNARARNDDRQQRAVDRQEEQREWYKRTLFERRLQAAQEALMWERRLRIAVQNVGEGRAKVDDVRELGAKASDWFGQNAAYLEYPKERFPSDFWGLLNSVRGWDGQSNDIDKSLNDLFTFLHNRINWLLAFGGKYEAMNGR